MPFLTPHQSLKNVFLVMRFSRQKTTVENPLGCLWMIFSSKKEGVFSPSSFSFKSGYQTPCGILHAKHTPANTAHIDVSAVRYRRNSFNGSHPRHRQEDRAYTDSVSTKYLYTMLIPFLSFCILFFLPSWNSMMAFNSKKRMPFYKVQKASL